MDAAQWPQVGLARAMEEIISSSNPTQTPPQQQQQQNQGGLDSNNQRRARPQKDQNVNCPRCNSTNTKFCYYNNYSLTQPRYFCKTCRRYWTQGGSLRNVPVGGGSRKNKRSTPPSSSSSSIPIPNPTKLIPDLNPPTNFLMPPHNHLQHQNPSNKIHPHPHHHGQDLNLAFPSMIQPMELPKIETTKLLVDLSNTCSSASTSAPISSALELLRTNISSSSLNSYGPVPIPPDSNPLYTSSRFASLQEMKPSLMGSGFNIGGLQENPHQGSGGVARLLFPFGDINKFSNHHNATSNNTTRSDHQGDTHQSIKGSSQDHDHHQGGNGYWNGMLGGGGW